MKSGEDLIQAIKDGKHLDVDRMLKNGYDSNCRVNDKLCTPALIVSVVSKRFKCLKLLLKNGAVVDARDKNGMTAAMYAADMGLIDFLHTLAENKADLNIVNEEGANMLILATKWDKFDCVDYLIQHGSDIDWKDKDGKTALIYAAMHDRKESLNLLIDANANLDFADSAKGFTALMYALEHRANDCANILLNKHAEVNVVGTGTESERTALTLAFLNSKDIGEFDMIEKLLLHGADMTLSKVDQSFLHEMIARNKKKIVHLMVLNGCPPFDRICWEYLFKFSEHKNPISPLCVALLSGFYDIAKYFIVNHYFTIYDVKSLPNDPGIRQKLQGNGERSAEALAVLDLICSSPQSLKVLSFITISEVTNNVTSCSQRRDKILNSGLPKQLQSELLFQEWKSRICLLSWHELSLEEDQHLEKCNSCSQCHGLGFRIKKGDQQ